MYDLNGLYYQMKINSLIFGVVGILFLVCSRFWSIERRNLKEILIGLVCCFLGICSIGYHLYIVNNLEVSVHEGMFVEEHRESPYLFRMEYCFSDEEQANKLFYLDVFSKKNIYPNDFEEDVKYKIYYEEKTDIIVKVEEMK